MLNFGSEFLMKFRPEHVQTAGFWSRILYPNIVFQGASPSNTLNRGSCSLFKSVAAFQHEKEPNELNISLDDLQSKKTHSALKNFHAQSYCLQRPRI